MTVRVINAQRDVSVRTQEMARVARCALRNLRVRTPGMLAITFIDARRMRSLNKRFLHHDRPTDVLSFRYDDRALLGDILITPQQARQYASAHGIAYRVELSRYVIHGVLHWCGKEDRTAQQQARMRRLEDRLLRRCGLLR